MGLASLLVLGLVPQLIAARTLQARQSVSCDFSTAANSGDTCSSFAASWGLTDSNFAALNPDVSCPGDLVAGQDYCVIGTVTTGAPTTTAQPTTTAKPTTTSTQTTSSSPYQPTQSGLAANCNNFHQVASGDSCDAIEKQYGISNADFSSWNPFIDSSKPPPLSCSI
jgi:LysM repeat protein